MDKPKRYRVVHEFEEYSTKTETTPATRLPVGTILTWDAAANEYVCEVGGVRIQVGAWGVEKWHEFFEEIETGKDEMNKQEIIQVLKANGFSDEQIVSKRGGIEVLAVARVPVYEFDHREFVAMFGGKLDWRKVHFLDPWTFTIECE